MSPGRSASVGLLVLAVLGCTRLHTTSDASAPGDATLAVDATADDASRTLDASGALDASLDADGANDGANDDDAYLTGEPRSARSIGHTSVVFKVELSNGKKAAWKPASRRGPMRYKGEIAARRLALALGLPNVPRAFFRALDAKAASSAAGAGAAATAELYTKEVLVSGSVVKGALIPWIDGLSFLPLEREPLASQWKRWLADGQSIPDDQRELARQVSTLVAFDFVTGNWDRWSGGNVGIDTATGVLLFIDNDGAFFDAPPLEALQKSKRMLERIDRFSRTFVAAMRALDEAAITRALGEEAPSVPLLSPKALSGVFERRRQLLAILAAKSADAGEERLLAFP